MCDSLPVVPKSYSMQQSISGFACAQDTVLGGEQSVQGSTVLQQKMFRQRQLALKRQRELTKNSFGVIAQQNPLQAASGVDTQKKAGAWGKFLVELDGNPVRSEVSTPVTPTGSTTPGRVKVIAAMDVDSKVVGAMAADTTVRPATGSISLTSSVDMVLIPSALEPENADVRGPYPMDSRNKETAGAGWDLEISAEDMRKSPKEAQSRGRKMWPWNRSSRVARIAEEDVTDRVEAFDDEVECIRASASKCNLRAKTPWSPSGATHENLLTEVISVPGELQYESSSDSQDAPMEQAPIEVVMTERSRSPFEKDYSHAIDAAGAGGLVGSPQRTKRTGLARLGLARRAAAPEPTMTTEFN